MKTTVAIFGLLLLGFLALTNPTKDDLSDWAMSHIRPEMDKVEEPQDAAGKAGHALAKLLAEGFMPGLIKSSTIRRNYGIFSTYAPTDTGKVWLIGVAGQFIPVGEDAKKLWQPSEPTARNKHAKNTAKEGRDRAGYP